MSSDGVEVKYALDLRIQEEFPSFADAHFGQLKANASGVNLGFLLFLLDLADSALLICLLTLSEFLTVFLDVLKDFHVIESMSQCQEKNVFTYNGRTTVMT